MSQPKPLSATMAIALGETMEHGGKLIRHVGGYWSWPNSPRDHNGIPIDHWGASTVEGLVARSRLEYTEWKEGRGGRFPIEATVTPVETWL